MRIESDSMGEVIVPDEAYYGAQTQRAIDNFQVLKRPMPLDFIYALTIVKLACTKTNQKLGLLDKLKADAIITSCEEILSGKFDEQFPVDVFQTGSATSSNMNVNEVIANRAAEVMGGKKGIKLVHPNNDVNKSQSSNDTVPSAIHIMITQMTLDRLLPALRDLTIALKNKEKAFYNIVKIGRTHMQDAVPVRLSSEFVAYKAQIENNIKRIELALGDLKYLALGATAIGTGLNAPKDFGKFAIEEISKYTNIDFQQAPNLFEALSSKDAVGFFAGSLSTLSASLIKIASDIRFLSCGPRCGIGELILRDLQPGSSIMPGKVNPVIPESVIQVGYTVIGYSSIVTLACANGVLELNVMMPTIAYHVYESIKILSNVINDFTFKCIEPLEANKSVCEGLVERSLALITPLSLKIGYDKAAQIAHECYLTNKTIKQTVIEKGILSEEGANEILNPRKMV